MRSPLLISAHESLSHALHQALHQALKVTCAALMLSAPLSLHAEGHAERSAEPVSSNNRALWSAAALPSSWPIKRDEGAIEDASATLKDPRRLSAEWAALEQSDSLPRALRGLTRFARGLAAYRAGDYLEASESLERAGDEVSPLRAHQLFLWGEALFHQGRYEEAKKRFEALQRERPGSLWGHRARFRLADVHVALGEHQAASEALSALLRRYPEYPYSKAALLTQALSELQRERPAHALDALYALTPGSPQDVSVHLGEALAEELKRLTGVSLEERPRDRLERVEAWRGWKYYERALTEVRALRAALSPSDELWGAAALEEVRVLNKMERFKEARALNDELTRSPLKRSQQRNNLWWSCEATFRLGDVEESARLFKASRVSKRSPGNLARLGMIYFNGARYQEALEAFEEAHKRGEQGDSDLWMARRLRHWLLYRLERYDDAEERFAKMGGTLRGRNSYAQYWRARSLQKRAERSGPEVTRLSAELVELKAQLSALEEEERARKAKKTRASSRAERRAQERALRQAKRDIKSTTRELKRAERRLKRAPRDVEEALALFRRVIERVPTSYYAYVSAARLREAGEEVSAPWVEHPRELKGELPEVPPLPDPLTTLRPLAQAYGGEMSGWEAVYGLALVGERRWAAIWLRSLFEEHKAYHRASGGRRARWSFAPKFYLDYRDDTEYGIWGEREPLKAPRERAWASALRAERPTPLFHKLEGAFRGLDDHYYGRRVSHYDGPKLTYPEAPGERAEWARRYPRSFKREVEESAARHGVDPHLIWALMTVESSHNPWAISRVGARGLMQVMPHTGQLSADRLSWPYFGSPLLFEPEVAVEMAAWYFKELSDNFHGQLPLAMAAYNAGPHRVKVWLEFKGELPLDELIEEIPYAQAREYAKKVTRHLALYRRIYEGHTGHLLNLTLNPAVKGNINF